MGPKEPEGRILAELVDGENEIKSMEVLSLVTREIGGTINKKSGGGALSGPVG